MHSEIFTKEQIELLDTLKKFKKDFYMVGGTAIALHIGHRYSIDFDLFTFKPLNKNKINTVIGGLYKFKPKLIWEDSEQKHLNVNGVKLTFFSYPYKIDATEDFENYITIPSLLDLAAMKALALGGRAKWKDYVDLYFILKNYYSLPQISERATQLFGISNFNLKLFKEQLSFFNDINYEEEVNFLKGFEVSEEEIKSFLTDLATQPF